MSGLQYSVYPGFGEFARESLGYNQAVRVDNRIELSGQGTLTRNPKILLRDDV